MIFSNQIVRTPTFENIDGKELRQLPQFFRASINFAHRLGGPLYRQILEHAPLKGGRKYTSVDSRIHMLMPGFWPCIPGWHCDDFHRPGPNGQPDLRAIEQTPGLNAMHHAIFLGNATAPTEFVADQVFLADSLSASKVYAACNESIEMQKPRTTCAEPGEFVSFDSLVWHRGTQAKQAGWRLFVRISESDHYEPLNELRTQTQVYLSDAGAGW